MKLSIVIPAYNEERRIRRMLDQYLTYFDTQYPSQYECIISVNGSTDQTATICQEYESAHAAVRVLVEPLPIGKGGAVIRGFKVAKGELVGFVDADGSTLPDAFDDLVQHIDGAGAIIANRWHEDSVVDPPQPWKRRVASRIFNFLVRFLFSVQTEDTQCGAKVFSAEAIHEVLPKLGLTRWAFDVDLLFQLRRAGVHIMSRPTVWSDVEGSRLNVPRASIEMLLAIVRLRLLYSPFKWVVRMYDRILGRHVHRAPIEL